ncbi:hypothetical protein C8J57DRAFT_1238617 [Mycena rebaudengoi]|nr:hypothetical protein C8J57DRAFT_1238617 [Mycena rebaudengoi]
MSGRGHRDSLHAERRISALSVQIHLLNMRYEAMFRVVQEMASMLMPTPRILSSVNLRSTAMLLEYAQLWGPVSKTAGSDGSCGSADEIRRERKTSAPKAPRLTAVEQLQKLRDAPRKKTTPFKCAFLTPLWKKPNSPADPFEGRPFCYEDPSWSAASDDEDDEIMQDAPPRWNVSKQRANAMVIAASESFAAEVQERERRREARRQLYVPWESARCGMALVAQDILRVGAEKRSKECAELGPAPSGFSYIQIGDNIHLTATDGNGSTMYIAHAASVRIVHN